MCSDPVVKQYNSLGQLGNLMELAPLGERLILSLPYYDAPSLLRYQPLYLLKFQD